MRRVAEVIGDKRVLRLIGRYPRAGVLSGGVVERSAEGTPQGGPLSPLLANIYLDAPDRELESRVPRFRRYADDCNIYVGSEACAEGDQGLDREASATEGERGQERGGEVVGAEVSGVSSEPPRAGGSGAGKYRTIPTEGAGDLARRPIGHESAVTRPVAAADSRLVGLLPAGRAAARDLRAGRMDTTAHTEVLLAAPAQCHGMGQRDRATGRRRALRRLGIGERLLKGVSASRGAWRIAANRLMQTALSNATLRRYGFVMPSDLAAWD